MAEKQVLFLYERLGVLQVSIPPAEPFFSIPMLTAKKEGENLAFGQDALEKDESWELTWVKPGIYQQELYEEFIRFVFQEPEIVEAAKKCDQAILPVQRVPSPKYNGRSIYEWGVVSPRLFRHLLPLPPLPYSCFFENRVLAGSRHELGLRYSLNISGNFTVIHHHPYQSMTETSSDIIKVGFDTVVNFFIKLLCEKGYNFTAPKDRLFCQRLVVDYGFVALDFEKELERIENLDGPLHEIEMEDGSILELAEECILATEVLFNPGLVGMDEENIVSLYLQSEFTSLSQTPSLILIGGYAPELKGLGERIQHELKAVSTKYVEHPVNVVKAIRARDYFTNTAYLNYQPYAL